MSATKEHIYKALSATLSEGRLLLCVSGGADSMALLHACHRSGYPFVVVHCDFHLRGEESERDREFVVNACERLGVKCVQVHFDVPAYMSAHGVSEEMACRELRYAEFKRLMHELECVRIVTAHNRDDNDETMLLNLFRGTGVTGLCGMKADTGTIARPLLEVSRAEIETYLKEIGEKYITDSSNLSTEYRRNFIRRELLPLIATRWPGIHKTLARTRRNMQSAERALTEAAAQLPLEQDFLPAETYNSAADKSLLLLRWLSGRNPSPTQIDEMAESLRPGCHWQLPDGIVAMQRDGLHLHTDELSPNKYTMTCAPLTNELMAEIRANRDNNVLYYSGGEQLTFRHWRVGERLAPFGFKGTKLVSDLLHEAGIPAPLRAKYQVAVDSQDRIIWIPGVRRSRHLCVRPGHDTCVYILNKL
ncbi:MAG: tRNA lysidine(34) synthetase TilS [Muribaculaceae bacterium]|nr:tRNA lysidine(34) synthetase TilS [Muribaculaceae bacterium]